MSTDTITIRKEMENVSSRLHPEVTPLFVGVSLAPIAVPVAVVRAVAVACTTAVAGMLAVVCDVAVV
jgi:hypothetical protein